MKCRGRRRPPPYFVWRLSAPAPRATAQPDDLAPANKLSFAFSISSPGQRTRPAQCVLSWLMIRAGRQITAITGGWPRVIRQRYNRFAVRRGPSDGFLIAYTASKLSPTLHCRLRGSCFAGWRKLVRPSFEGRFPLYLPGPTRPSAG